MDRNSKIVFTEHAAYQIIERNISKKQIIYAISKPDKIISQSNQKFQAVKLTKKGNKKYLLIVIYSITNSTKKVITAFLTTKIKKYLK